MDGDIDSDDEVIWDSDCTPKFSFTGCEELVAVDPGDTDAGSIDMPNPLPDADCRFQGATWACYVNLPETEFGDCGEGEQIIACEIEQEGDTDPPDGYWSCRAHLESPEGPVVDEFSIEFSTMVSFISNRSRASSSPARLRSVSWAGSQRLAM